MMRVRNQSRSGQFRSFGDTGSDALAALSTVAPTVTIQTTVTPEIPLSLVPNGGPGGANGLAGFLRPTLRLYGPDGIVLATVAPAGVATGISSSVSTWAMLTGLFLGGLFIAGYALGASK